jgi:hypothetical protein
MIGEVSNRSTTHRRKSRYQSVLRGYLSTFQADGKTYGFPDGNTIAMAYNSDL